ncbi:hypothetical protein FB561_6759 [Kribbella amoyensis]|uniref:Uncharacterized protein n=1 Tax=Kribbella amoyensis TaxID=996641 RepID=A0A561B8M9_9ACTN|nr:hypothetical protein [Kribbella amoyensis]TWD75321.1 hypothetical protein FB561_6759 [Kribbella amoyensis]
MQENAEDSGKKPAGQGSVGKKPAEEKALDPRDGVADARGATRKGAGRLRSGGRKAAGRIGRNRGERTR